MKSFQIGAAAAALLLVAGAAAAAPAKAPASTAPVATQQRGPAATAAVAPTLPPINHGPPIVGVCVYYDDRAIGTSTVGQAAGARMQQLRAQVAAELQAEQTGIQTDGAALNAKRATLTPDQLQQQFAPLQARAQAFEAKAQQRQRELEATGAKASQRIHAEIDPILRNVYQAHACSLLLNGDAGVYIANPQMDLTQLVVAQLNTKLPTITFDREIIAPQPQQ